MVRPSRRSMKEDLQNRQNTESGQYSRRSSIFKRDIDAVKFFKCKEGDNLIDIIPYKTGEHDPLSPAGKWSYALRIFIHSQASQTGEDIICLEQTFPGKKYKCPVCAEYRKRFAKGASDEELKPFKYAAWPRVLYNIVDRKNPSAGVQVFNSSSYLFQQYLDVISRKVNTKKGALESFIPFADPDEGRSIAFDRQGMDSKTKFIGIRFEDRDDVISDEILDAAHCLDDIVNFPTEEEAFEAFWGHPPGETSSRSSRQEEESDKQETSKESEREERRRGKYSERKEEQRKESEEEKPTANDEDDEEAELERKLAAAKAKKEAAKKEQEEKEKDKKKEGPKEKKKPEDSDNKCPAGGTFGKDIDDLSACESCDLWKECAKENDRLEREG